MRFLYMIITFCIIGIIVILWHKFSGKRQIMLGEAKRGRVWPEHIVRAYEYWLYCDSNNKSTQHLLASVVEITGIDRSEGLAWLEKHTDNYIYYVETVHPNVDPRVIDQSRRPFKTN